ncbi:alpha/beta hydrolase family protein [Roseimaritima sediminicola]|uniref:alpha/beta hydrolase family protein n=1 Tax=Roseimaritima sediminicola TaxID=2662066 RepID=UPI001F16B103|nr:dienelactone hydrolase family protein [Roseimaritima sediminicola]
MPKAVLVLFVSLSVLLSGSAFAQSSLDAPPLPGTEPLTADGDLAAQMVAGADAFLLRELERSVARRAEYRNRDESNRQRLAHILGVRDPRLSFDALELVATTARSHEVGQAAGYKIFAVRWPVIRNVHGEGLLLVPDAPPVANAIAIPDADQTPEMICGLEPGLSRESQFARRLAESGCRVLVPTLISREVHRRGGRVDLTNREYLYRSGFVLGRHLIGFELQKILAGVDWYERESQGNAGQEASAIPTAVVGYGEGGMLALYAAALDPRIDRTCVAGYFGPRETLWQQPISRNVFGLLERFGDAELAAMVLPRKLVLSIGPYPNVQINGTGAAQARLGTPSAHEVQGELERLRGIVDAENLSALVVSTNDTENTTLVSQAALQSLLNDTPLASHGDVRPLGLGIDTAERQRRQVREIEQHNQWLLGESPYVRQDFMNIGRTSRDHADGRNRLDTSSIEAYQKSIEPFRDTFREEIIGHFDLQPLPFNARSRKVYDDETWEGYEVVLDVFPDVFAYGILCLPKDLMPGEKRPVVVCQHGLEGRPRDVVTGDHRAYHDFASKLAERGYITFAPQNLYIGKDKFRTLQRKANPIGKTLFSLMVPQHQQIVDWLQTQPFVDGQRIAFYGLSYGGKSAMRIPPLVPDYCLSICSADFNEWVGKNASTRSPYSYVWTGEYEIFEFDLGSTFNYAEMAALIAPRPFMVERGHFDGVGSDEDVAYEFAKVRHLYAARLDLPERCEIETFVGPHTIHGQGTFEFLDKHLKPNGE